MVGYKTKLFTGIILGFLLTFSLTFCSSEKKKDEIKIQSVTGQAITTTQTVIWGKTSQPFGEVSSDGSISCTSFIDYKISQRGIVVLTSSVKTSAICGDTRLINQDAGYAQLSVVLPSGAYSIATRLRWELKSTSTLTNELTGQVITGPLYGYFENDNGVLVDRDSEFYSLNDEDLIVPYVYYFPVISK